MKMTKDDRPRCSWPVRYRHDRAASPQTSFCPTVVSDAEHRRAWTKALWNINISSSLSSSSSSSVHEVCNGPSPTLSAHRWSVNRIIYCDAVFGGSWSWRLYWLWTDDAEPRSTDRFAVLRCFTSAAYRTSPSTKFSVPVAYCCTRSFPIGLLQQCPVWTSC